jgi:hypothetical protein
MKHLILLLVAPAFVLGCAGEPAEYADTSSAPAAPAIQLEVTEPEPLPVPEEMVPSSDQDWAARINNKNREVVQLINTINPVAAYVTAGFEQYGDKFSPTLQEEWTDTQHQLTQATTLYEDCQKRMEAGTVDKQLFLDLEGVWQLLVKTGVAGLRAQSMVDAELKGMAG